MAHVFGVLLAMGFVLLLLEQVGASDSVVARVVLSIMAFCVLCFTFPVFGILVLFALAGFTKWIMDGGWGILLFVAALVVLGQTPAMLGALVKALKARRAESPPPPALYPPPPPPVADPAPRARFVVPPEHRLPAKAEADAAELAAKRGRV